MDIFRSVTQTVLGAPQPEQQTSAAETVERLIDRVQSSTLLEDRRDGCRALKTLSRKYRVLVGAHGMDAITQVLEMDRGDHDIVNYSVEILINITSNEVFEEETEEENVQPDAFSKVGEQFTEIFTKRSENISLLLSLLDEYNFKVRYPVIKLLTNLLTNRPKDLQEVILVIPSGVSKLMDLLSDGREVIRNDMLRLLTQLTHNNTSLQKIVAFENAFDVLFEIIKEEGYADGGVVVEDCLFLMLSLLNNNPSNQTFFKEGSFIQRLTKFFTAPLQTDTKSWSSLKVSNVHNMLKLVRTLVSPQNATNVVHSCQEAMYHSSLLHALCELLMKPAAGVPADILTDTITTVSELIRGNQQNQHFFSTVMAPYDPPKPAIVILLMSMVNDKQPFLLRCSVLYCFQCFLYRNQQGQSQIVQTLLPQTTQANQITSGQLLCGGLFSTDPVSNWFSAIALSHALLDNTTQKEQLLRVQLATGDGTPAVSLMQQCVTLLQSSTSLLTKFGLAQLLASWLAHSPMAVTHFLNLSSMVPYLLTNVSATDHDEMELSYQGLCAFLLCLCGHFNDGSVTSFTREALTQVIANRVGAENFRDKLNFVTNTEAYSKSAKYPQLRAKDKFQLVFDHEFCRLFKSLEASSLKSVTPQLLNGMAEDATPGEVLQYKDIIRDQDAELTKVRQELLETKQRLDSIVLQNQELSTNYAKLQEQINNPSTTTTITPTSTEPHEGAVDSTEEGQQDLTSQVHQLTQQLAEMTYARDYYYYQMVEKQNTLEKMGHNQATENSDSTTSTTVQQSNDVTNASPDITNLQKQLEDLQIVLHDKDAQIENLKENSQNNNNINNSQKDSEDTRTENLRLETTNKQLTEELQKLQQQLNDLKQVTPSPRGSSSSAPQDDIETLKRDQEDLLVLLTDQDTKLSEYKKRLQELGQSTSDDDEEDLQLPDDDDDDDADLM